MKEIHTIYSNNNHTSQMSSASCRISTELAFADRKRLYNRRKRKQQLKNRIMITMFTCFTCIMTICCAVLFGVFNSKAKDTNTEDQILYKYYKSIEIESGDTLWDLAKENYSEEKQTISEYIKEVQNINHLKDETLISGNHIVIPYYSTEFVCN